MAYRSFPPNGFSTTLTATSDTLTVSPLNGNADGDYKISAYLLINTASTGFEFKPNSQNAGLLSLVGNFLNGSLNKTDWTLARSGLNPWLLGVGNKVTIEGTLRSRTNVGSRYFGYSAFIEAGTNDSVAFNGVWTDTTTNMTSFQIVGNQANAFNIGSWLRAWPMRIF